MWWSDWPGRKRSLDTLRWEMCDIGKLALAIAIGVADQHEPFGLRRGLKHSADDLGEVGVRDVVDDHPDRGVGRLGERPSVRIGAVAELAGCCHDLVAESLANWPSTVERARGGCHRDPGAAGAVAG